MHKRSSIKGDDGFPPESLEGPMDIEPVQPARAKNPAAVELGRLGGLKGGKARAIKLTADERKDIAKKAANARWGRGSHE
jgi:hypothetical protein